MKPAEYPAVRASLQHLRDAEFPGWEIDDQVDGTLLRLELRKNPDLRLDAMVIDFIEHWLLKAAKHRPKSARGWRQGIRNWGNNAVCFGNWYAVPGQSHK